MGTNVADQKGSEKNFFYLWVLSSALLECQYELRQQTSSLLTNAVASQAPGHNFIGKTAFEILIHSLL